MKQVDMLYYDPDGDMAIATDYGAGIAINAKSGIYFRSKKDIKAFCKWAKKALKETRKS